MKYDVLITIVHSAAGIRYSGFMLETPFEGPREHIQGQINILLGNSTNIEFMTLYCRPTMYPRDMVLQDNVLVTSLVVPGTVLVNSAIYCQLIEIP